MAPDPVCVGSRVEDVLQGIGKGRASWLQPTVTTWSPRQRWPAMGSRRGQPQPMQLIAILSSSALATPRCGLARATRRLDRPNRAFDDS